MIINMIINLTPHAINLIKADGTELVIPPSGELCRCSETIVSERVDSFGVRTIRKAFGEVTGLPDPVTGTIYIVSGICLNALKGTRHDVRIPGEPIRDEAGRIIGARALIEP